MNSDLIWVALATAVEGSYEYYFTPDTSIGGTVFFNGDGLGRTGNFGIGPNLRAYFGYNPKSGIFAEAFGLYYTRETDITNNLGTRNNDYSTIALGLGLGRKWSTFGQKLTMEIYAGLGRNVNQQESQDAFMYRAGLSLGFRFKVFKPYFSASLELHEAFFSDSDSLLLYSGPRPKPFRK